MKKSKILALILALALVVGMLAGCATPDRPGLDATNGGGNQSAVGDDTGVDPNYKKLTIGSDMSSSSFAPTITWGNTEYIVGSMVYEPLGSYDENGELAGIVAKSWTKTDADGFEYDFEIYDYVTDTKGNHITAADVCGFFQNCIDDNYPMITRHLDSYEQTGDYTFHVKLKKNTIDALTTILTSSRVYSQKEYQASADKFVTRPVGTTAYVITDFEVGGNITLKRAERPYWQTDESLIKCKEQWNNIDEVVVVPLTEASQQSIALETGTIDIMRQMNSAVIGRFQNDSEYTVYDYEKIMSRGLYFSGEPGRPTAENLNLRLAICHAIDTQGLVDIVMGGRAIPEKSFTSSKTIGFNQKWLEEDYYEYDVEKAKQYLEAAGYKPGELTLQFLTIAQEEWQKVAQVVQSYLGEIGINVEIMAYESALFSTMMNDGTQFDIVIDQIGGNFYGCNVNSKMGQTGYNGKTKAGFVDDKLEELIYGTLYEDSTQEDFDALHYYLKDTAYVLGLYDNVCGYVYKADLGIKNLNMDYKGMDLINAIEFE